jgi:lysophospholipase L1-like esterase
MQLRLGKHSVLLMMPFFISFCSTSPKGVIVLCAGDSITAEAYPHFLQRIFNSEGRKARVLNYGRNGHTSGEYLSFLEKNGARLEAESPDFILLELGTNDVRADIDLTPTPVFKSNMKRIIEIFRSFKSRSGKTPVIFLATIPPVPEGTPLPFTPESVARVDAEINPALKSISQEERIPLVDHYELFFKEPGLLRGVHPSPEGYRRIARHWFESLQPFLSK